MLDAAISGLPSGGAYALVGIAVVLMYRLAGVMNIAVGAFGAFGAYVMVSAFESGFPLLAAVGIGVAAGAAVSALMGILMAWLFPDAEPILRSAVTIAMTIAMLSLGFRVFGDAPRSFPALFPGSSVEVSSVVVRASSLIALGLAVTLAALLWFVLRHTRIGIRMAAMSTRPVTAELLGIPIRIYTVVVWGVGGAVASIALILAAPTRSADFPSLALLVVPGLAAALLGAFRSFGLTAAAGIGIGVIEGSAVRLETISNYRGTFPFILIVVVLMWSQRSEVWDESR